MTVPGPDSSSPDLAQWTPRKLDKQRSVTFASLDPLEPIEEDFPQVRVREAVRECLIAREDYD